MMRKLSNIEEKITNQVNLSDGMTTKDIAKSLSIGMGTASKYLEVLHTKGLVHQKRIGPSNYWTSPKFAEIFQNFSKFKDRLQDGNDGITFADVNFIIFPLFSYTKLIENTIEKFGYEKTKEIFYPMGKEVGTKIYEIIHSIAKWDGQGSLDLLINILNLMKFLGYGKLEVENNNMSSGQLTVIYHPPREHTLKDVKNNAHFLIAGMLASIVSEINGLKLECEEIRCTAKGDPHCKYTTRPVLTKKIDKRAIAFNRKMEARHRTMEQKLRMNK